LTSDASCLWNQRWRFDELVLDPLVIASMTIVIYENRNSFAEMSFAEEDKAA
jgi:hypothetical protein